MQDLILIKNQLVTEGYQSWEKENSQHPQGINPYAFAYGFRCGFLFAFNPNFKKYEVEDGAIIIVDQSQILTPDFDGWYYDTSTKEISNCFIDAVPNILLCYPIIAYSRPLNLNIKNT